MLDKTAVMKEAQKHLAKGAVDKALLELEKLVKESPDGNTFNIIGDIYLKKGNRKTSTDYFQKAAKFFWHEGFSQKAQALYKKVLNINPADADALYAFGELSEEKGLITDAIKYFLATADILAKEGRQDKISDIYQKILSLSPENIPLRIKIADIFIKEGLKSDAAREYVHLARIHDEKSDFQKAREFFQKAINIQPLNKEATLGLSHLHEKTGEVRQAMEQMKDAIVLFPEDLDILFRCSEVSLLADDAGNAKACLIKIIERDPKNIRARRMLGDLFLKAGSKEKAWEQYAPVLDDILAAEKHEDAISLLDTLRPLEPFEITRRLVSLYKQVGEKDRACDELIALGDICASRDMEEEARAYYTETLEINPEHAVAMLRLAPSLPHSEPEAEEPSVIETEPAVFTEEIQGVPGLSAFDGSGSDEFTVMDMPTAEETKEPDHFAITGDKSLDEVITEADIFSRYGLIHEAQKLLEDLKQKFPRNIDVHLRLKTLYTDIHDKETAVTECIILSELYKRGGETEKAEQALKDAFEINPEDPRLAERGFALPDKATSHAGPSDRKFGEAISQKELAIEDYEEEIAEADFYARQGLIAEAVTILEKLHKLFPGNTEVHDRLEALGQSYPIPESADITGGGEMPDTFEISESDEMPQEVELSAVSGAEEERTITGAEKQGERFEIPDTTEMFEAYDQAEEGKQPELSLASDAHVTESASELHPIVPEVPDQTGATEPEYENFSLSDSDLVEAQEMTEPQLDNDVLDIFQEFKKGLEKELGDEDSETHYNLGIAYKEMGLVDDAIKEFQTSRNDHKRFIQSSSMLGVCYMEKGLYTLAIDVLNKAVKELEEKDESYWAMTYELAEAYEKNNNLKEANDLYTQVYGWNAKFRNVSDKMTLGRIQAGKITDKETEQGKEKPKERKDRVSYL